MATFTINTNAVPNLLAVNDDVTITETAEISYLYPMNNDQLGLPETILISINTLAVTIDTGTIEIDNSTNQRIKFTPNGSTGTNTFNYTIEDSLGRTSTALYKLTVALP